MRRRRQRQGQRQRQERMRRVKNAAAAAEEGSRVTANAAAASANRLSETMNNELHGEAIHLTYEIGGFDVSQGGEVVAAIRAQPVDKAIFVRNGMRVTGGGTYQVDVTEVDSAGAGCEAPVQLCG